MLIQRFTQYPGRDFTTAGEAWRAGAQPVDHAVRRRAALIVLLAIAIFYFAQGPLGAQLNETGRRIERFTPFERAAHWTNATAFVVLAISGLVMAFGKYFLLPVIGATLFGWLTYALKTAHNFAGPLFAVSLVVVFFTFLETTSRAPKTSPGSRRAAACSAGRRCHRTASTPARRSIFWFGVFGLGALVVGSGLVLDKLIPGLAYLRGDMQIAHIIHAAAAVLMMCMFLGHIYLGTHRHAGRLSGDARRLCRRRVGARAPRAAGPKTSALARSRRNARRRRRRRPAFKQRRRGTT